MEGGDSTISVAGRGASGSAAVAATVQELLQDGKVSDGGRAWVALPWAESENPTGRFAQSFPVWTWPLPFARPPGVRNCPGPRVSWGMCSSLPVVVLGGNTWYLVAGVCTRP